jgi:hypothetical protein
MSLSVTNRFRIVLAAATFLSVAAVPFGAFVTRSAADGQRGGAIAVALSFIILFLSRGYGTKVYKILTEEVAQVEEDLKTIRGAPERSAVTDGQKIEALVSKTKIDADNQEVQNFYLAWSSGLGTIAWGFGDIPTQWLIGAPTIASCAA